MADNAIHSQCKISRRRCHNPLQFRISLWFTAVLLVASAGLMASSSYDVALRIIDFLVVASPVALASLLVLGDSWRRTFFCGGLFVAVVIFWIYWIERYYEPLGLLVVPWGDGPDEYREQWILELVLLSGIAAIMIGGLLAILLRRLYEKVRSVYSQRATNCQ